MQGKVKRIEPKKESFLKSKVKTKVMGANMHPK
jgi:hypothetical protein